jgi:hypothetical protein
MIGWIEMRGASPGKMFTTGWMFTSTAPADELPNSIAPPAPMEQASNSPAANFPRIFRIAATFQSPWCIGVHQDVRDGFSITPQLQV